MADSRWCIVFVGLGMFDVCLDSVFGIFTWDVMKGVRTATCCFVLSCGSGTFFLMFVLWIEYMWVRVPTLWCIFAVCRLHVQKIADVLIYEWNISCCIFRVCSPTTICWGCHHLNVLDALRICWNSGDYVVSVFVRREWLYRSSGFYFQGRWILLNLCGGLIFLKNRLGSNMLPVALKPDDSWLLWIWWSTFCIYENALRRSYMCVIVADSVWRLNHGCGNYFY